MSEYLHRYVISLRRYMYTLCRSTLWYQDSYCFNTVLFPLGFQKYINNEHSSYRAVVEIYVRLCIKFMDFTTQKICRVTRPLYKSNTSKRYYFESYTSDRYSRAWVYRVVIGLRNVPSLVSEKRQIKSKTTYIVL